MLGRLGFDFAALSLASLLTGVQPPAPSATASVVHRVDRTQLMADVRELSSDQYQGRRTGTPGGLKARGKGLPVGMDIGKDGQQHAVPPPSNYRQEKYR